MLSDATIAQQPDYAIARDTVLLTSARGGAAESLAAYAAMGFAHHDIIDLPV